VPWLLAFFLALAVAGAVNLALSVRAMRKGGLGPVPVPPQWHPEFVPTRAMRIEARWGRMQKAYLAHQWWMGRVAGGEVALGLAGAAAVVVATDTRPWGEVLLVTPLLIVAVVLLTSLTGMLVTVLRRLRELNGPGGLPGLGRVN
jgi:hypothetical protein